jgi:hypothetical protein
VNGTSSLCVCPATHTGSVCQTPLFSTEAPAGSDSSSAIGGLSTSLFGAVVGIGCALVIILALIFVALHRRNQRRGNCGLRFYVAAMLDEYLSNFPFLARYLRFHVFLYIRSSRFCS